MDKLSSTNLPVDTAVEPRSHPAFGMEALRLLVSSLRPRQWTKNGVVFMALVFSVNQYWRLNDPQDALSHLVLTFSAFLLFCALSSGEYLVNDLLDIQKDREHPTKRNRPLASGRLDPSYAMGAAVLLIGGGLVGSFLLSFYFGLVALAYAALTMGYSLFVKHVVILDIFSIAAGFVLRAIAGAVVISVPISPWLYLCTSLGALFLGINKRRHELLLLEENASKHRGILQEYSPQLLDSMSGVVASSLVVAYSFYTFSAEGLPRNHSMMLTIPFVLYGILRYQYLVHIKNMGGGPEDALLADKPLLLDILLWVVTSGAMLVLFRDY